MDRLVRELRLEILLIKRNIQAFLLGFVILFIFAVILSRVSYFDFEVSSKSLDQFNFVLWWFGFVIGFSQLGTEVTRSLEEGTVIYWRNLKDGLIGTLLVKVFAATIIAILTAMVFVFVWTYFLSADGLYPTIRNIFFGLLAGLMLCPLKALIVILGKQASIISPILLALSLILLRYYILSGVAVGGVVPLLPFFSLQYHFGLQYFFIEALHAFLVFGISFFLLVRMLNSSLSGGTILNRWGY